MLRVATFNQYQPGLSRDDLSDVGAPFGSHGERKAHVWHALRGWGQRLYRRADIVFLQEVRHAAHIRFLAQPDISGLPYWVVMQDEFFTDLAILSRYPLFGIERIRWEDNPVLRASVAIGGQTNLLFSVHWSGRTTESSPSVRRAAQKLADLIRSTGLPAIVGGDLNFVSGYGPGPNPGSAPPEYIILTSELRDVYKLVLPQRPYCSDKRIDYILCTSGYEAVDFHACLNPDPSDHPFLVATLKPPGESAHKTLSRDPVTAVSPAPDELVVAAGADRDIETARIVAAHWSLHSGWRGWQGLTSAIASAGGFAASVAAGGMVYLFWIGSDGWVYHKWRRPDGVWSISWPAASTHAPSMNAVPGGAVHAVSCDADTVHMFYARRDGRILMGRRSAATGGTWPETGGILGGATAPGGHITAASRRPGQVDVFTVGTDGRVYTAAWNAHEGWRGWWVIGGIVARPGTYIGAVSRNLDHLDIFLADPSGRIMSAAWEPQFGWRGWWHIQAGMTTPAGYVTAVSRSRDKLDIFTTGTDWRVWTAAWEPAFGWRGWWPIGNATAASPIWPVTRSRDKLDIFFVSPERSIQTAAWEPGRTWGGPWDVVRE